jgi:hypothetical protein
MIYAVDDDENTRRRMEEIKAERRMALTGSTLPEEAGEVAMGWPMYGYTDDVA